VLCRMGGVGTWVLLLYAMSRYVIWLDLRYHLIFVEIICTYTLHLQIYSVQSYINIVTTVIVGSLIYYYNTSNWIFHNLSVQYLKYNQFRTE